jgi:hypothetical protein
MKESAQGRPGRGRSADDPHGHVQLDAPEHVLGPRRKPLFYHGVSDAWFSALDTVDYYEPMTKAIGGAAEVTRWSRLFLVPGRGHGGGGPAALETCDTLNAIVEWVEQGTAPASIAATGRTLGGRRQPLCPHPQHAHYKGTGNADEAGAFECRQ